MSLQLLPTEAYLAEHQLKFDTLIHPESYTALQTAHAAHISPAQMVKSLLLWDGSDYLMCLLPASHVLVLSWIDRETGKKHRFASEQEITEQLQGCAEGAVPALGQAFDMPVIWDHSLRNLQDAYFEAGDHKHLIHMEADEFLSLLDQDCSMTLCCTADSMEYYQYIH